MVTSGNIHSWLREPTSKTRNVPQDVIFQLLHYVPLQGGKLQAVGSLCILWWEWSWSSSWMTWSAFSGDSDCFLAWERHLKDLEGMNLDSSHFLSAYGKHGICWCTDVSWSRKKRKWKKVYWIFSCRWMCKEL